MPVNSQSLCLAEGGVVQDSNTFFNTWLYRITPSSVQGAERMNIYVLV